MGGFWDEKGRRMRVEDKDRPARFGWFGLERLKNDLDWPKVETPAGRACCSCGGSIIACDEGFVVPMNGSLIGAVFHRACLAEALGLGVGQVRST